MIRSFDGETPAVPDSAFVSEMAYLIGDVTLGERSSVWPFVCLRGDSGSISVGDRTNVQDFTMLHNTHLGADVTVGHGAMLDHATIGDQCLVGLGATLLPGATVGSECIVAGGTLLREGESVPEGHLAYGAPAETQPLTDQHRERIEQNVEEYLKLSAQYRNDGGFEDGSSR